MIGGRMYHLYLIPPHRSHFERTRLFEWNVTGMSLLAVPRKKDSLRHLCL